MFISLVTFSSGLIRCSRETHHAAAAHWLSLTVLDIRCGTCAYLLCPVNLYGVRQFQSICSLGNFGLDRSPKSIAWFASENEWRGFPQAFFVITLFSSVCIALQLLRIPHPVRRLPRVMRPRFNLGSSYEILGGLCQWGSYSSSNSVSLASSQSKDSSLLVYDHHSDITMAIIPSDISFTRSHAL